MSGFASEFRRGWRNLLAASIGLGFGIPNYTSISSLFFRALETEFHWSKAAAAVSLIALPISALMLPVMGWAIDRRGVRLVAGMSMIAGALSFLYLARMTGGLGQFYGAVIALYVLGCATGPVAYTRPIAADFRAARGTALAAAQFGTAFLAMLLPLAAGWIIQEHGWRAAYDALAVSSLVGGGVALLLLREAPAARGEAPAEGVTPAVALHDPAFWMLAAALLAGGTAVMGLVSQLQSVLVERGISPGVGPRFLAALAASVMVSRLIVGRLLDLPHPTHWAAAVLCLAATGALLLALGPTGIAALTGCTVLIGFGLGAEVDLLAYFCVRLFGMRHYSAIYGILGGVYYGGTALGGVGYGVIHDATGGYAPAIAASGALLLLSALAFTLLPAVIARGAAARPR